MYSYKVCVYAICKNEEAHVPGWVASMQEADQIIVTDTGSSDHTPDLLRQLGVVVYEETILPWRFDTARNRSLSHVPEDTQICVCTDLDERFLPGWRKALEKAWKPGFHMGNYLYNWSLKPDGSPDVQMTYFKIHSRHDYVWEYPVHECLRYTGNTEEKKCFLPGVILNHDPDPQKSRSSYLPLLESAVQDQPSDPRMSYYLGREYFYLKRFSHCIHELTHYLALPHAVWTEERCSAMSLIARSYEQLTMPSQAFTWFLRSIAEAPFWRDPYIYGALFAYRQSDWPWCLSLCLQSLKITEKSSSFINEGIAWDHTPWDLAAVSAWHLGMYPQAFCLAEQALSFSPEDPRLQKNLRLIEKSLKQN